MKFEIQVTFNSTYFQIQEEFLTLKYFNNEKEHTVQSNSFGLCGY